MSLFYLRAFLIASFGIAVGLMYTTPGLAVLFIALGLQQTHVHELQSPLLAELRAFRSTFFLPWFKTKPHEFAELAPNLYKMDHPW